MPSRSAARLWTTLILLAAGMAIAFVERVDLSVAVASEDFQRYFSPDDTARGVLNSAFFLTYAILQIPAGWAADHTRSKRLYGFALLAWSLITLATGLSTVWYHLLAARLLLGTAESVLTPVSMRWIRSHFPEAQRGTAIGILQAGSKLGPAIGLPLSAWLIAIGGWRFLFFALGGFSLLWLLPWWWVAPDEVAPATAHVHARSASPTSMLSSPILWGALTGTFCYQYFFYFCVTWMPSYLTERHHLSLASMGWYSALSFGGMSLLAVAAGWCADRLIGAGYSAFAVRKWFAVAGLLFASTEVIGVWSPSPRVALVFVGVSLCGLGLATANHWALTQTAFPGHLTGRVTGLQAFAASLPGVLAPVLTGWMKQTTGSYNGPVELVLVVLVIGLGAYLLAVRESMTTSTEPRA